METRNQRRINKQKLRGDVTASRYYRKTYWEIVKDMAANAFWLPDLAPSDRSIVRAAMAAMGKTEAEFYTDLMEVKI